MSETDFAPFVQLHLLTFYPPSNLNRDDQGRPKTAMVGGHERQRISSQALKRAWRTSDIFAKTLAGHLASRTQRIGALVLEHLLAKQAGQAQALKIAQEVAGVFGLVKGADKAPTNTEQLAFISPQEREAALKIADARLAGQNVDEVKDLPKQVLQARDTAADIAMFGRMLAASPEFNFEAAVSVAHAITTNRVVIEDDYFTAVDDLKKPEEDAGAAHIGETAYGSGVFYLYITIDRRLLLKNLGGDHDLAKKAISALTGAAATIGPRGKAASFASFAKTSFILAERGAAAPRTLASAFLKPMTGKKDSLMAESVQALKEMRGQFAFAYPEDEPEPLQMDISAKDHTLADIIRFVVDGL